MDGQTNSWRKWKKEGMDEGRREGMDWEREGLMDDTFNFTFVVKISTFAENQYEKPLDELLDSILIPCQVLQVMLHGDHPEEWRCINTSKQHKKNTKYYPCMQQFLWLTESMREWGRKEKKTLFPISNSFSLHTFFFQWFISIFISFFISVSSFPPNSIVSFYIFFISLFLLHVPSLPLLPLDSLFISQVISVSQISSNQQIG